MTVINKFIRNFVYWITDLIMERKKRKTKEKKDPQYMLFIFGDFVELEHIVGGVSTQMIPIVTSPFLKYTYGEYGIVFNFRSKETFSELKQYVDMAMSDITDQYFLLEVTKNMDIKMPRKLKKDFLNIDGSNMKEEPKNGEIKKEDSIFRPDTIKYINFDFILPTLENPYELLKDDVEEREPTVDEILDKIKEKGIESLTKRETEILDNYGKRKD